MITKTRTLNISKSHNTLRWLDRTNKNRRIPRKIVRELSALKTMEQAQAFVESAGLRVMTEIKRFSRSVNSVSVRPPGSLDALIPTRLELEYHAPQIVLPRIGCDEVPFGTVLVNCLLPRIDKGPTAETIFREYQSLLRAIISRLDARPFACITGHKTDNPSHALDYRGFRFFFGPDPGPLFERIRSMLESNITLFSFDENGPTNESKKLAISIQNSLFCVSNGQRIGHSILDDIKLHSFDTSLIDLREQYNKN
ncbi:MAG: hypothetical protein U9R38_05525 [Candidatus Margulisiibacteriota bacterium]|nr:hypothetical protein [Candidatus Margulisiibacteriota bacterium]